MYIFKRTSISLNKHRKSVKLDILKNFFNEGYDYTLNHWTPYEIICMKYLAFLALL